MDQSLISDTRNYLENISGEVESSEVKAVLTQLESLDNILKGDYSNKEISDILLEVGTDIVQFPYGKPETNQELAIRFFQSNIDLLDKNPDLNIYGYTLYNLGQVYLERIAGDSSKNLIKSIDHYKKALSFFIEKKNFC